MRYQAFTTPWFDYLIVSQQEMREILDGTGWAIGRILESNDGIYTAIIERE